MALVLATLGAGKGFLTWAKLFDAATASPSTNATDLAVIMMTPRAPFAICDAKIYRGDELWGCELAHIPIFLAAPFLKAAATAESARVLLTAKLLAGSVHARPAKAATDYQWSVTPHDLERPQIVTPPTYLVLSLLTAVTTLPVSAARHLV